MPSLPSKPPSPKNALYVKNGGVAKSAKTLFTYLQIKVWDFKNKFISSMQAKQIFLYSVL